MSDASADGALLSSWLAERVSRAVYREIGNSVATLSFAKIDEMKVTEYDFVCSPA